MIPSDAQYNECLAKFRPLLDRLAQRCGPPSEYDDLMSIGMTQLWLAMQDFNPECKAQFATYVYRRAWGHMGNHMRRFCRELPYDLAVVNKWRDDSEQDVDVAIDATKDVMSRLSPEDGEFLRQYYLDGKSAAEVARATGTTRARVYNRVARIKNGLRAEVCV